MPLYSFEMVDMEQEKAPEGKSICKIQNLPLVSFEFITEFFLPATTLCIFIMDARALYTLLITFSPPGQVFNVYL